MIVVIVLLATMLGGKAVVPDLTGLSLTKGVAALDEAGLELGEVAYTSDIPAGIEEGQVVTQRPTAGEEVDQGTSVDVVVAGKAEVTVPDVVGMTAEEAADALGAAGLEAKSIEVEHDAEAGTVVDQAPEAGSKVAPGSEVTVMVSAGPVATSIPNVIGLSEEDAKAALEGAGYQVETKTTYDERFEEGLVVSQAPEAGTAAEAGTLVTIVVSKGKNPEATVPDVVGMTEAEAAKVLQDAGFDVVPAASFSDTVPSGSVINQDPEAGATALIGSAVSITVSQGPEPPDTAIVPDVVGKTQAEATEILTGAGYEVAAARAYSETVAKDVVAGQAPMADSVTEPGITVGILVSDGPRPGPEFVLVPDLTGMTLEEATAVLEQAGLQAVSFEFFTELAPEGQVFAQLPPAEFSVAPGSTVLVIVSKGPYVQVNPL